MEYPSFLKERDHVFIIAEVGLNHNGQFDLAVRSIEEAARAGADAVKFQNYRTEDFLIDSTTLTYTYQSQGKTVTESMWGICKRCEMPRAWLPKLKKIADDAGIIFCSTPTSESGVDDLVNIDVRFLKNGSDYLSHLPLLAYMGSTGIPVVISTGMAFTENIQDAVAAVQSGGDSSIILLHCTSSYPTEPEHTNLRRMVSLRETFGHSVGFSDHTVGSSAACQAVTLGASILEKHFTLDHDLPGPDHWFSVTPSELAQYVKDVRDAEQRLGSSMIEPAASEKEGRNAFRLSLIAVRDLPEGYKLTRDDFIFAKPGTGLSPKAAGKVVGRSLITSVKKGVPLKEEFFS